MSESATLYERIGGEQAIAMLVDKFYDRVLADPELAPFFKDTSMDHLLNMQREFFTVAMDGPTQYTGMDLTEAHYGRGITTRHFSRYVQHLTDTLRDIGVVEKDIEDIIPRISLYANHVCGGYGLDG